MAEIFLTNTLTRKKEPFSPVHSSKPVTIYSCGPTVYRNIHIGNLRTYISADLLVRTLEYNKFQVNHVKNITDVGHMRTTGADEAYDPIINEAIKEGKTPLEIAAQYTKAYQEDQHKLSIHEANENPIASAHIEEMKELIKVLIQNGLAYETSGNVYFDVKKYSGYGKLSGNTLDKMNDLFEAVRVSVETDKKDSIDFALWKKGDSDRAMIWKSDWSDGFPGWHIECSAMSLKHLTDSFKDGKFDPNKVTTIDIHTGGEDLIFPHHEDEIAQSEGASGKKFVNFWFHGGHLTVDNKKMSRSSDNFYTLADIEAKGFQSLAFRYLCLTAHYRSRLNFTWDSLAAAQTAFNNLYREISSYSEPKIGCAEYEENFLKAINDDLDIPSALAVVWDLVKSDYPGSAKLQSLLKFDEVLGIGIKEMVEGSAKIPEKVQQLLKEREEARKNKDFQKSDQLRKQIADEGFEVIDEENGQKLKRLIN